MATGEDSISAGRRAGFAAILVVFTPRRRGEPAHTPSAVNGHAGAWSCGKRYDIVNLNVGTYRHIERENSLVLTQRAVKQHMVLLLCAPLLYLELCR